MNFAENLHELWAMRKIDLGWSYGEVRSEQNRLHHCLTSFDHLPDAERAYNINLALETLKTIEALGWHMMLDKPPTRLRPLRLPQSYVQSNGYKPQPLDTHEIELPEGMQPLIEALARNTHNVWAKEKIKRGWTFGISDYVDAVQKRTPHLVPYEQVDERIKEANREAAAENIRTLQLYGIYLETPITERDLEAEKELQALDALTRTFRAEATYKVINGKWYYEFEVLTEGFMKVGWMDVSSQPESKLGVDALSYGFDGHLVKKWHQGAEHYGRAWKIGDVVGCFLDLNDRTISFSLNGELLLDPSGSEMAFDNVQPTDGFVPAMTLAAGQKGKFNFGQDSNSLKFFTTCGLQEGYEPFCVNMFRPMPFWYAKRLPRFTELDSHTRLDVQRVPATTTSPPCLKISQKAAVSGGGSGDTAVVTGSTAAGVGGQETGVGIGLPNERSTSRMEFLRLSLPVKCNRTFNKNSRSKEELHAKMEDYQQKRNTSLSSLIKLGQTAAINGEQLTIQSEANKAFIDKHFSEKIILLHKFIMILKARGKKGLLSVFRQGSQEPLDPDRRSQRTYKTSSFDSSPEHPIMDGAAAMLVKSSLMELSPEERKATKKSSGGILGRIRQKQQQKDEVKRHQRTTDDTYGLKGLDTISASGISRADAAEITGEMPSSGPGRQPTIVARRTSPLKKRFGVGKRHQPMPAMSSTVIPLIEMREPSLVDGTQRFSLVAPAEEVGPVLDDVLSMQEMGDQIDEYYFGVRIFPGQDLSNVWVGWVRPQFHAYDKQFNAENSVRRSRYTELDHQGDTAGSIEYRNCYMLNAAELLSTVADPSNTKVSGLLIGCLIDTAIGELAFYAQGQDTGMRFKLEPEALLFPSVFVQPTSQEILQFELGRIKFTYPLSSAVFKSSAKALIPYCPPRLCVENLRSVHWARVPSKTLRASAIKLSDSIGWSVLCDEPVRALMVYIPERDESIDILELIEKPDLLAFHERTLCLYCKLAAHGNQRVAHQLCSHVDEKQLIFAVRNPNLSGPMRQGLINFLIAVHLKTHADARLSMAKEFIIPLVEDGLNDKHVFDAKSEGRYPQILGSVVGILPTMKADPVLQPKMPVSAPLVLSPVPTVRDSCSTAADSSSSNRLLPPQLNFLRLKEHVMNAFRMATRNAVLSCRDFMGGGNLEHFEPILKLLDSLLIIGLITDEELVEILQLIHPASFGSNKIHNDTFTPVAKGLADIELAEGVKLQLVSILEHLCDIQVRHRIESLAAFSDGFVAELQQDQCRRYLEIKQTEMPPAEAAKRTKEFRCPPKEQMYRLLNCKVKEDGAMRYIDDEADEDQCPTSENLQDQLREFCQSLVFKVSHKRVSISEIEGSKAKEEGQIEVEEEELSWVDKLAQLLISVPPIDRQNSNKDEHQGTEKFRQLIVLTLRRWANESEIESNELIRAIFALLLRQYSGVVEMMDSIGQTYVLHERNLDDVKIFIEYLMQIRELLNVQLESTEEGILKRGLWQLMNNRIFFQHPDLMRLLRVHEDVMTIMMNVLTRQQSAVEAAESGGGDLPGQTNASEMVVACSRFLCYFCRTSRLNQKAMFEHLSFLLDNATMLLARPSLRGSVPLDVAYSSFMDNNELALALKEEELDKVAVYLMRCGLQPNSELLARDYPDIGWDPVEGERYLDFLRFCVWINGENVEENANLVIRLLIRRPECLGVALKGEGQGLFAAFKEAISLSEDVRHLEEGEDPLLLNSQILRDHGKYPSKEIEGEDYMDLGASILDFYSSLVDLLAKCAPDPLTIQAGKGDSVRARAILRSLISLDDLRHILALRFTIPNLVASGGGLGNGGTVAAHDVSGILKNNNQNQLKNNYSNYGDKNNQEYSKTSKPPFSKFSSSNSMESKMHGLVDTTNTFANIAATLSARVRQQSISVNYRASTLLKALNTPASKAALFHQLTTQNNIPNNNKQPQSNYQTANNSIASTRSNSPLKEVSEGSSISGDNNETSTTPIPPPLYNEGLFCRRRGVSLPKRSACNTGPQPGLLPNHKQSVLLFLDRVYGIDSQACDHD
ncbi:unnamed protein product [Meloidogyne enterolobii]|uniref:Uncharacterized protein n=1 Tax=Meloidogyne enterolobii TaxID=390850 RepID=A0ACB0Z570_MELEN